MGVLNQAFYLLLLSSSVVGGWAASKDCAELGPATYHKNTLSVAFSRCDKTDDRDFADEDFDLLSKSFLQAYDAVGAAAEVEYCLSFEDVEVVHSSRRRLQDAAPNITINFDFLPWFELIYRCFGCPEGYLLFNDAFRMLETQGLSKMDVKDLRPRKKDFVEKFREILGENGICLESLDELSAVEVEAPNASASFDQLAASLHSLIAALFAFAVLL